MNQKENMTTKEVIRKLRDLDLSTYPYNEIHSLIQNFNSIKVIRTIIEPGAIITRIRNKIGYHSQKEMSYPPVEICNSCQRANLPRHSMFYGTISDSTSPTVDNRAIAVSECSSLARKGKTSKGIERFTISNWISTQSLQLATIVDDKVFEDIQDNKLLKYAKEKYNEFKLLPEYDEYARFVAEEFSKPVDNEYEYLISAAIADAYVNQTNFDGIMYPSVRLGGQAGMNIALKPEIVDSSLALQNIGELVYYKNAEHGIIIVDKLANIETWNYFESPAQPPLDKLLAEIGVESLEELELV